MKITEITTYLVRAPRERRRPTGRAGATGCSSQVADRRRHQRRRRGRRLAGDRRGRRARDRAAADRRKPVRDRAALAEDLRRAARPRPDRRGARRRARARSTWPCGTSRARRWACRSTSCSAARCTTASASTATPARVEAARELVGRGLHRLQVQPVGEGRSPSCARPSATRSRSGCTATASSPSTPPCAWRADVGAIPAGLPGGADQPRSTGGAGGGGRQGRRAAGGRRAAVPQVVGLRDDRQRARSRSSSRRRPAWAASPS